MLVGRLAVRGAGEKRTRPAVDLFVSSIIAVAKMDSLRGSSVNVGTIQRRSAWLLRNDDTHTSRSANNLSWLSRTWVPMFSRALKANQYACSSNTVRESTSTPLRLTKTILHTTNTIYAVMFLHIYIYMYMYVYIYIYVY